MPFLRAATVHVLTRSNRGLSLPINSKNKFDLVLVSVSFSGLECGRGSDFRIILIYLFEATPPWIYQAKRGERICS